MTTTQPNNLPEKATISERDPAKKRRKALWACISASIAAVGVALIIVGYFCGWWGGVYALHNFDGSLYDIEAISNEQLSIHFLRQQSNGDCVYIKAGDVDVLIDSGASPAGAASVSDYVDRYCRDGVLEYVVVTHGDADHTSGFVGTQGVKGLFARYDCQTIIQFSQTNATGEIFENYCAERDKEIASGAKCYTALQCFREQNGAQRVYNLSADVSMEILYHRYYEEYSSSENNYSVCVLLTQGGNSYLFTGDLEQAGEQSLVQCNPQLQSVTLYKAAHHGSASSSGETLLAAIRPKYVCVCCVAGSVQYSQQSASTFPTQQFIDRIAAYTDNVFVTDCAHTALNSSGYYDDIGLDALNGDIVFACTEGKISMYFSHSDAKLKDTDWFQNNRSLPAQWSNL